MIEIIILTIVIFCIIIALLLALFLLGYYLANLNEKKLDAILFWVTFGLIILLLLGVSFELSKGILT